MEMIDRAKEAAMIGNSLNWAGETLCLKKRPKPGETPGFMGYVAFGVITNSKLPITVYLQPNYIKEQRYKTIDALLDDGWIVD